MTRRRSQAGQSLAEFALVAPIFFLLVFAVIQIGLVFAAQNGLVDGVRSAARRAATYRINEQSFNASVFPTICTAIATELDDRLAGRQGQDLVVGYQSGNLTRTISYEWIQNPEGGDYFLVAHITARYKAQLYVPLVSNLIDQDSNRGDGFLEISASEQMRVENPPLDTPASLTARTC